MKTARLFLVCTLVLVAARAQTFEVQEASIADEQRAMAAGRVTSKALVQAYLSRIEAFDVHGPKLNALLTLNPDALKQAEALDRERAAKGPRGPLHGIPIVVKDNYGTADMSTTAGSMALLGFVPLSEAVQVRKLREAGAVIIGKANLHELASGITTISSAGGQTLNPYDPSRNPGGSSGGTGAAIAASFAAAGMGTDTCGSIRIPASQNSLVGLRPTKGLSSIAGIVPLSVTQDVAGPLARSVADLAALLDVTSDRPLNFAGALHEGALKGARIGILEPLFGDAASVVAEDQEAIRIARAAVEEMKRAGAVPLSVPMPELAALLDGSSVIDYEFKEDLADYLAHNGHPPVASLAEIVDKGLFHASLEAVFRRRLAAKGRDSEDYRQALAKRSAATQAMLKLMEDGKLDALVYPTMKRRPARIGDPQAGSNCQLSATTGYPAISVPAGFTMDGLPIGIELFGRPFDDAKLVGLAFDYERATHHRQAPARTPALGSGSSTPLLTWQSGVPATGTTGAVLAKFSFDPATSELTCNLTASGFREGDILAATLHRGKKGDPGPAVAVLAKRSFQNLAWADKLSNPDRDKLFSGAMYLRIATRANTTQGIRIPLTPPAI